MAFTAGPLALSLERLFFFIAFGVALLVGWLAGRRERIPVEPVLTRMLLTGFVTARLAFVLMYLEDYLRQPLSIIDIRDGGFFYEVGIAVAAGIGAFHGWRQQRLRKPLGAAVSAGLLVWAISAGSLGLMQAVQPQLPDLPLTDLNGDPAPLDALKGKPVVVNLWATWCPPCRAEMPIFAEAQQREEDIEFVFINQGEHSETVQGFLSEEDLDLRNVLLDFRSASMPQLGAQALPTTFFFDARGVLVDTHLGALSTATLKQRLKHLQDERIQDWEPYP
ncbi:redoxin family protein [Gilvimarinus sp. F26214L]|uniref:redoxin family protein n=1 Tax=Gilvimarinus sp. DZF01 TaxID=3461371 RepID=UPI00404624F2